MKSFLIGIILVLAIGIAGFVLLFSPSQEEPPTDVQKNVKKPIVEQIPATEEVAGIVTVDIAPEQSKNEISVSSIDIPVDTWVVLYADDGGKPGTILSSTFLAAGEHTDVSLPAVTAKTDKVYTVLHRDSGTPEVFEFPGTDVALAENGRVFVYPVAIK